MNQRIHRCIAVLSMILLAGLWACAEPTAPTTAAPEISAEQIGALASSGSPDLDRLARYRTAPVITIAWAKKWIGPEGGRLEFQGFAIDVPPGAVNRVTQFSIRMPVDPNASERVVAEFGPHRTFDKPVAIELPYAATTAYESEAATVVWWDSEAGRWVDMGGTPTDDGERLRTQTDHFSLYGTADSRGDTVILSGG